MNDKLTAILQGLDESVDQIPVLSHEVSDWLGVPEAIIPRLEKAGLLGASALKDNERVYSGNGVRDLLLLCGDLQQERNKLSNCCTRSAAIRLEHIVRAQNALNYGRLQEARDYIVEIGGCPKAMLLRIDRMIKSQELNA